MHSRPRRVSTNRIIGMLLIVTLLMPMAGCTIVVGGGPSQALVQAQVTTTPIATTTATATDVILIAQSATPTSTRTPTVTDTPTPTETGTATSTSTATATPTFTGTSTETGTPTSTGTATPTTVIPTATQAPMATSARRTPTATSVPYDSSEVAEPTATPTSTSTGEPTETPTVEATETPTLTATPTATMPPTPTATASPAGGLTETPVLTSTETTTSTATLTATVTVTSTEEVVMAQSTAATPYATEVDMASSVGPTVSETTITIDTYDYESALVSTKADDPVFPYPRLNHDRVGPPSPEEHRAVILENKYLALTILPDLGGRIYRWIDKTSGRNLFYENPVVKPTSWGYRGWWLATGGMEWALPLDEHGLSEASEWQYTLQRSAGTAGVTVSNKELRTGLVSSVSVSLDADHNYFTLTPKISNPTVAPVPFKFWINGMFSLGSQQSLASVDFVLPTSLVTVHSTSDRTLPKEHETMEWPVYQGRDLSKYANWSNYLGVFASPAANDGFMGAYNHYTNLGVVRVFPYQQVPGAKVFGMGELDPVLWTDDDSSYFELWGGLAPTFWDQITLDVGETVSWQEWWYALGDVGGFRFANTEAALNLGTTVNSAQVAAASTHPINGQLVLWQGEDPQKVMQWPIWLAPDRPFRGSFIPEAGAVGPFGLSLYDETGRMVASIGKIGNVADVTMAVETAGSDATASGGLDDVQILDIDGEERDWSWVEDEFGYELLFAPALSSDGKVFRLAKLQEVVGSPLYVVEEQNERGRGLSDYYVAFYWPDAPKDISSFTNQKWHGFSRAMYGYPTAQGEWGIRLGKDSLKRPGEGECATFVLSEDVPSDVLTKISPLAGTDYRTLRPTFRLVSTGPSAATTGQPVSEDDEETVRWDSRLDTLGITLIHGTPQKGKPYFQLISARLQDEDESAGFHHIFVEVLDEDGDRIVGQNVVLAWDDGQAKMVTEDKDPPEYAANVPMYADGRYRVYVDGGASDVVDGMRLPGKKHVSYLLTFQRAED